MVPQSSVLSGTLLVGTERNLGHDINYIDYLRPLALGLLEWAEQRGGEKVSVAVKAPQDGKGCGRNLQTGSAGGQASGRVRWGQVCDSPPWPGGLDVYVCGNVLWKSLVYLCS